MARAYIRVGGVNQQIKRVKGMADLRTFKRIRVMVAGVMQTVWQYLTVTASPDSVTGSGASPGSVVVTSAPTSVFVVGGTAPTYSWALIETFGGVSWTINNPTSAVTTFSATLSAYDTATGVAQCTVTDGSTVLTTNTVEISLENSG